MPKGELDNLDPKKMEGDPGGADAVWRYSREKNWRRPLTREEAEVFWRRIVQETLRKGAQKLQEPRRR